MRRCLLSIMHYVIVMACRLIRMPYTHICERTQLLIELNMFGVHEGEKHFSVCFGGKIVTLRYSTAHLVVSSSRSLRNFIGVNIEQVNFEISDTIQRLSILWRMTWLHLNYRCLLVARFATHFLKSFVSHWFYTFSRFNCA